MGEKGNLMDTGEEIFANLAEQGPQFWINYEQYKVTRAKSVQPQVAVDQQAGAVAERQAGVDDPPVERPGYPATG